MIIDKPEISIVVPVYNSALIIPELAARVDAAMLAASLTYELLLTDDCSNDNSWQIILSLASSKERIKGFRLWRNCGQWAATLAGMSKASGKFIVTIDDDLEYEPADIVKLYSTIKEGDCQVVFGLAKEKYLLQGKNQRISKWRKGLVHKFWNSPVTDSFKIMDRNLVFDGSTFLPTIFVDAYIVRNLDRKFIGYTEVGFNKRFAGVSNTRLFSKIKLFILYSIHFTRHPVSVVFTSVLIFLFCCFITDFLLTISPFRSLVLSVVGGQLFLLAIIIPCSLWLVKVEIRKRLPYLIIEETNTKSA